MLITEKAMANIENREKSTFCLLSITIIKYWTFV